MTAGVMLPGGFLYDYYNSVWILPDTLVIEDAAVGKKVSFLIWNAQIVMPTTAISVVPNPYDFIFHVVDGTVLLKAFELREARLTLGRAPASSAKVNLKFRFENDDGVIRSALATLELRLFIPPEPAPTEPLPIFYLSARPLFPINEDLEWKTDILTSWSSSEQRICLRDKPRHSYNLQWSILDADDWQYWQKFLYTLSGAEIVLPLWHLSTPLTQDGLIGTNEIFFHPEMTDIRAGAQAIILSNDGVRQHVVTISQLNDEGAVVSDPLEAFVSASSRIVPCASVIMQDKAGPSLQALTGRLSLSFKMLSSPNGLAREGTKAQLRVFDGMCLLERRPIIDPGPSHKYVNPYTIVDFQTGARSVKRFWDSPEISGARTFRIDRRRLDDLDWWALFLDTMKGRQKTFLFSTYKEDLTVIESKIAATEPVLVKGNAYADHFYHHDPRGLYTSLHIRLSGQDHYFKCTGVAYDSDKDATRLMLEGASPMIPKGAFFSFLHPTRLESDRVKLVHHETYTNIHLTLASGAL